MDSKQNIIKTGCILVYDDANRMSVQQYRLVLDPQQPFAH